MTTALAVANEFIKLSHSNERPITNMKLQKLVYFAQGFYAAMNNGERLFKEDFEAWKYGPVIPELYHKFKVYFAGAIPANHPFKESSELTDQEEKVIQWVYDNLGKYTAIQLSNFSHLENSPWATVFNNQDSPERVIAVKDMAEYFEKMLIPSAPTATATE